MSTKIPWFRYGFKETKKWLKKSRQSKSPCIGEISDALDRCNRQNIIWRHPEEDKEIQQMNIKIPLHIKSKDCITGPEAIIEFGKIAPIENDDARELLEKVIMSLITAEEKLAYLDGYLNGESK